MDIVNITTSEELKKMFDSLCNDSYDTMLDLGCGKDYKLIKDIKCKQKVGVEVFKPYFDIISEKNFYETLIFGDVRNILNVFRNSSFDLVLGIDFIEHMQKEEGKLILSEMEKIARKEILLFTPYKFYHQDAYEDNPYQEHRSGWEPEDFEGYHVYILPKMHGTGALVAHKKF